MEFRALGTWTLKGRTEGTKTGRGLCWMLEESPITALNPQTLSNRNTAPSPSDLAQYGSSSAGPLQGIIKRFGSVLRQLGVQGLGSALGFRVSGTRTIVGLRVQGWQFQA